MQRMGIFVAGLKEDFGFMTFGRLFLSFDSLSDSCPTFQPPTSVVAILRRGGGGKLVIREEEKEMVEEEAEEKVVAISGEGGGLF